MNGLRAPLLEIVGLKAGYAQGRHGSGGGGAAHVVNGVSLKIGSGQSLGLVGESGSGKSTLGRAILRLIEPSAGSIRLYGIDVRAAAGSALKSLRRHMQPVMQDPAASLNPRMNVGRIISEPLEIHSLGDSQSRQARVAYLLERVGLPATTVSRYPHELSGGQKQRVGIARALALQPCFLVLDEPVSALDVSIQAQILELLKTLKTDLGLAYLFISHNLAVIRQLCEYVAVMENGMIVEQGPTAEVLQNPVHAYSRRLLSSVPSMTPNKKNL